MLSRLAVSGADCLYNWDAVQFALALNEYDVVKHQPHPPRLQSSTWRFGRLVHGLTGDAAGAYVVLAVLFSGAGTFVVYLLGARDVRPAHGPGGGRRCSR